MRWSSILFPRHGNDCRDVLTWDRLEHGGVQGRGRNEKLLIQTQAFIPMKVNYPLVWPQPVFHWHETAYEKAFNIPQLLCPCA